MSNNIPDGVLPDDFAAIKQAAKAAGVRKSALKTDVVEHFKRGAFSVDTVAAYLLAQKESRPHWFKGNDGESGGGKPSTNPWSREAWNVTRQGECVRAMGLEKAAMLASRAGSKIGATKPPAP